ncbi:MAG: hypothetical protein KDH94_08020, partial [Coxiellaceae bacterium]|nr:hypothetical protein [Coxiellaceae bacterium]
PTADQIKETNLLLLEQFHEFHHDEINKLTTDLEHKASAMAYHHLLRAYKTMITDNPTLELLQQSQDNVANLTTIGAGDDEATRTEEGRRLTNAYLDKLKKELATLIGISIQMLKGETPDDHVQPDIDNNNNEDENPGHSPVRPSVVQEMEEDDTPLTFTVSPTLPQEDASTPIGTQEFREKVKAYCDNHFGYQYEVNKTDYNTVTVITPSNAKLKVVKENDRTIFSIISKMPADERAQREIIAQTIRMAKEFGQVIESMSGKPDHRFYAYVICMENKVPVVDYGDDKDIQAIIQGLNDDEKELFEALVASNQTLLAELKAEKDGDKTASNAQEDEAAPRTPRPRNGPVIEEID